MALLEFQNVTVNYGDNVAVRDISLSVNDREFFVLLGPSGAGKSSIIAVLTGRIPPKSGIIKIAGKVVNGPDVFVPARQRGISAVFQDGGLWPHMTVLEHLLFVLKGRATGAEAKARAEKYLDMVKLSAFAKRLPSELSGGERQRLAVARSLVAENRILILDEPFANLDRPLAIELIADISALHKQLGLTSFLVTHQQEDALLLADRIGLMAGGEIVQVDTPYAMYTRPKNAVIAGFFGDNNFIDGRVKDGFIECSLGRFAAPAGMQNGKDVVVCARPASLTATRDGAGVEARMLSTMFKGEFYLAKMSLQTGETLSVNVGAKPPEPGAYRLALTGEYAVISR